MKYNRIIPCILLKQGLIVRSQNFRLHQILGNPMSTVQRLADWKVDELIVLNISGDSNLHDLRRNDIHQSYDGQRTLDVLKEIAQLSRMPLTFGGMVRSLKDIERLLNNGADKVSLNTILHSNPKFIKEAVNHFGSQCIVASVDVKAANYGYDVLVNNGSRNIDIPAAKWCKILEEEGVGEILINSIDRDGTAEGYDLDLIRLISKKSNVPVIAIGGVGQYHHFAEGIMAGADAVAAANIFHFREISYHFAKMECLRHDITIRNTSFFCQFTSREPIYDQEAETRKINQRIELSKDLGKGNWSEKIQNVFWCTSCLYPSSSAAPLEFNSELVCTGCQMSEVKTKIPDAEWKRRRELFSEILKKYKSKDGSRHDIIIAVSGGKDSYYQTHVLKEEFGMNPLLVTYDGNNWTETGWRNMIKMREVFGVDHIIVRPSIKTLVELNRLAFIAMGDMNWHAHVGIMSVPMMLAIEKQIPLVIYGEHGYQDIAGQFSMNDFPELTYRERLEHYGRGFEWTYFVGQDGLTEKDLIHWQYPTDQQIADLDLRGLHLGNFVHWEANDHAKFVIDQYGFETPEEGFERTYRKMSNLDDMHENGAHDYLKYIKFGYGRCTDHVCKDIRAGIISRDEGIELIKTYDHVRPSDIQRWVEYVGMTHEEFDAISDTFRDPMVWSLKYQKWFRKQL